LRREATPCPPAPGSAGGLLLGALFALVLLAGCATPQTDELLARARSGARTPAGYQLIRIPFHPQEDHACGPAALATVLGAAGEPLAPEALAREVYLPGREGTLAPELLASARRHGRLAVLLDPTLDALLGEIDAGHPVLVLLNLGLPVIPVWHFAVVTGYDLPAQELHLQSGRERDAVFALATFERTWARGDHWAMVATAPGDPAATPSFASLLDAAAALERNDARAALTAWQALAGREPARFEPWMGAGNSAAALGELAAARDSFARAAGIAPASGDAWNNLASALLSLHDVPGAREAIARALALGGSHRETYEQTAREIEAAR
jgi:hypothetical protein